MTATGDARSLAAQAASRVLGGKSTLDAALEEVLDAEPRLAPAVRSLSYGAVRGFYRHEAILDMMLSRPAKNLESGVRAILSVALFELEDAKTPHYAVVAAAVEAAKSGIAPRAAGLVNAVLRRYLRERTRVDSMVGRDPIAHHAFPAWLGKRLQSDWPERWQRIFAASDDRAPMWLRVDSRRIGADAYVQMLGEAGRGARTDARVPFAVLLDTPCEVSELPGFAEGLVSVQDLAAQCVAFPLQLAAGQRVLDLCSAPGGKTALIAEREPSLAELVAVEVDARRVQRVRENLGRGGLRASIVVDDAASPEGWWDGIPFDRVLLDAPCSALGVIRRHPDIRLRRTPQDIDRLSLLQARLLIAGWRVLARGGRLVYVTCTLTRGENRDIIAEFLKNAADARIERRESWRGWPAFGEDDGYGCQMLPGEAGADGFYYAALVKQ